MNAYGRPALSAIQRVPWETPHHILDNEGAAALPGRASEAEPNLIERTAPGFEAFAAMVAAHRPA